MHKRLYSTFNRALLSATHLALAVLVVSSAFAATANNDRSTFGASAFPIWSELSYFERDALSQLERAKDNDPNALLALGLVASGSRDLVDYENVQRQISAFTRRFKETNKLLLDEPWELGQALNSAMHSDFFLTADNQGAPNGYDEDQSRLMGIFETSEYNCISSALLYGILAKHMGLESIGVLLPSHAFIELSIPGRSKVEVETTSPGGFDQDHNEEFYERSNSSWFSSRGLEPATFEDYQNRKRMSLVRLTARNMLNQHTREERMDHLDSVRLAEIAAYIDPNYLTAQKRRLHFYSQEIFKMITEERWDTLNRFFDTTFRSVSLTAKTFAKESSVQASFDHYLGGALLTHAHLAEVEPFLDLAGLLMSRAENNAERTAKAETRIVSGMSILLNQLAKKDLFEEGVLVMTLIEGHIKRPPNWAAISEWFYMRWADYKWRSSDWQGVITVIEELMQANPIMDDTEKSKTRVSMLSSAFYNWSLEKIHEGDKEGAVNVLQRCLSQFNRRAACKDTQQLVKEASEKDWLI